MPELSLAAALLVGFLGGVHCVGMCGPLVGAFSLQRPGESPGLALHLAANLGRIASYTAAGALAGLLGASGLLLDRLFPVERLLFVLAQVMLILLGLYLAGWGQAVLRLERMGGALWARLKPWLAKLLPIRTAPQAFAAGALWGWLPCGLVYSVLITAFASGSALRGAATMAAFGLGTLPNLLAMGWFAGRLASFTRRRGVRLAAGVVVAGLGVLGLLRVLLM